MPRGQRLDKTYLVHYYNWCQACCSTNVYLKDGKLAEHPKNPPPPAALGVWSGCKWQIDAFLPRANEIASSALQANTCCFGCSASPAAAVEALNSEWLPQVNEKLKAHNLAAIVETVYEPTENNSTIPYLTVQIFAR